MNMDSLDSESDQEMSELVTTDERDKIKQEISNLSFEELLKMKEEMGSKLYNKTFHGEVRKTSKSIFQRANKNRPREMSSKIRPKGAPVIPHIIIPQAKKVASRDPRFDPLCGQFEEKEFKSNYKFLNDMRIKEKEHLQIELKNCSNPEHVKTIKMLIQRTTNQIREQEKREKEQNQKYEERKEFREKLKNGEHPRYKKKSVQKLENLVQQYETLKKTNKLQKHIEKRSKKIANKHRHQMNQSDNEML
ncbi:unnamed protein product [Phaedon cochleariae]|uniref:rRNA biogenesis protein RRP36 n=1 Tax=Phaedon cochleariae TaxID=80249 RepID=A0A9N9SJZ2_PHACE|nr:unnamed protein product [Phaedon cochleariae]